MSDGRLQARTDMAAELELPDAAFRDKYRVFRETTVLSYRMRHLTRVLDAVASRAEDAWLRSRLDRELDRPIFVTGNYRSGTTLVERIITRHPDVGFPDHLALVFPRSPYLARVASRVLPGFAEAATPPHQPNLRIDNSWPAEWEAIWRVGGGRAWSAREPGLLDASYRDPALERLVRRVANKQLLVQGKRRFANKNPLHTLRAGFLLARFPGARIVHMVRHPLRVVQSQLDMERIWARVLAPTQGRDFNDAFSDLFLPPQRVFPKTRRAREIAETRRRDPALATAMSLVDVEEAFDAATTGAREGAVLRVRYEDLSGDFERNMTRVFEHCALADAEAARLVMEASRSFLAKDLRSQTLALPRFGPEVEGEVAGLAERYGYDLRA